MITIHDINGKTSQPEFWHAVPAKWDAATYTQGQPVNILVKSRAGDEPRTVYLKDAARCTFSQFLRRWQTIDGASEKLAKQFYTGWWQLEHNEDVRVFLFSHNPPTPQP